MNTRTKWIIFMAVVLGFSVLWPLSYMLRGTHIAKANETNQTNNQNILRPLTEYSANFQANVTEVFPELFATGYSNYGDPKKIEKIIKSWDGVDSVNVTRLESRDPNYMYQFLIKVNLTSPDDNDRIGFWLKKKLPIKVESVFSKVNISFPQNITFTSKTGLQQTMSAPSEIKEYGYYYVKPGENPVYVYLAMSGSVPKEAVAIAGNQFYLPPMKNYETNITGNITNITKGVILVKVPYGANINETELSSEWNATVNYFPARSEIICPNTTKPPGTVNYTERGGKYIVKFNKTEGPDKLLSILPKDCQLDTGALRIECSPERMNEIAEKAKDYGNVTDMYYLARVKIPKQIIINGENVTLPIDFVSNVKTNKTSGEITFPLRISMAFDIPVGVSYAGSF